MFTTDDSAQLGALIDAFKVPMFIADAMESAGQFMIRAINKTHSDASMMDRDLARDLAVRDLLGPEDAEAVNANYARCIAAGSAVSYDETLEINGKRMRWHTTLVPARSDAGRDRVVGNAVLVENQVVDGTMHRVFQDIDYFSVQSQFQLDRVSSYLDALQTNRNGQVGAVDLEILSALCRTVDRTLQDIRALAGPNAHQVTDAQPHALMELPEHSLKSRDPVRRSLARLTQILQPIQ